VIERLLENWLDSASERSYQAVFVQMLSGLGFRVVHSTRHAALEFGKDVLAVDPDGRGCAYQLKGNPGTKLGLAEFREIQGQLVQLMSQPVIYPGFPDGTHRAFLVTNGYFEEEVQRAVDDLNRGPYPSKVTLISRGELLDWSKSMGVSLWPSELSDVRALLELFLSDSSGPLPLEKLGPLLGSVLETDPRQEHLVRAAEFDRMVTSSALLTGIATGPFAHSKNHYALASAWTLLAVMLIGSAEKHGRPLKGVVLQTVELAEAAALDALIDLWMEVDQRKHLVEGNAMADTEVYGWRYCVLLGALSCLALANDSRAMMAPEVAARLEAWLRKRHVGINLWSEAAAAQLAPWLIFLRKHDPTLRPDLEIAGLTEAVIRMNQSDSTSPLPGPYYTAEEVFRHRLGLGDQNDSTGIAHETFDGSAYTARALFHLLVRTNLKRKCKELWPGLSRLGHRGLALTAPWHYCLLKVDVGRDETFIYPRTYEWDRLKADATSNAAPVAPKHLIERPWLLAMWWQIAPHRFNLESSRALASSQIPGWGT
jgi:hypothetical protein